MKEREEFMIDEKEIERVKEGETLPLLSDTMFKAAFIKNMRL